MQSIITFWQMAALVETPSLADPFEAKLSKPVAELAEATGGRPLDAKPSEAWSPNRWLSLSKPPVTHTWSVG